MNKEVEKNSRTGLEIAVIGMAGRYPGAANLDEYWRNLKNGVETIAFFSREEIQDSEFNPGQLANPAFVKAFGVLEDIEYFDAAFFDYTPVEAEGMNPLLRIFHEVAWEALENAGYNPDIYEGTIGLYAGGSNSFYWEGLSLVSGKSSQLGALAADNIINKDYLSTMISYRMNLKGPAVTVQTACSTSLVAIHWASRAVLSGECNIALAGGIAVNLPKKRGYLYQEGMVSSPDGHTRTFDARAKGTLAGNGAGIVVLKKLKNALAEGDHIYAMIKGSAINNDGRRKVGFTAPSVEGQAEVIRTAMKIARIEPETITYIEAHGTATTLGDPVEIEGLKLAFDTDQRQYCAIGTVKSNIGHLDSAAGAAGFIKTVLALKHRLIPPSLHYESPNPAIDFERSPFYVNHRLTEWKSNGTPLRAAVSSLGIGGTNAHIVLEEAPEIPQSADKQTANSGATKALASQLLLLSAKTSTALETLTQNLVRHLETNPHLDMADIAYTLQVGRKPLEYKKMLVCSDTREAIAQLQTPGSTAVKSFHSKLEKHPLIFMFSGLGAQYVNMGRDLYEKEPLFREEMDRCFAILKPLVSHDIKEILYPSAAPHTPNLTDNEQINRTEISQLAIFILEYSLARVLMKLGLTPRAMIGYSFGEYAAACISGVFTLEEALELVVNRAELMAKIPAGIMLSVPLEKAELEPLLDRELSIAVDNGPSCIIAGPPAAVEAFEKRMKEKRLLCMRLKATRAVHSSMMAPIQKEFQQKTAQLKLKEPQIPYISNLTGTWCAIKDATDPAYWARHLRETVQFAAGVKKLLEEENAVFVEIGPGRDLCAILTRYIDKNSRQQITPILIEPDKNIPENVFLINRIGYLWLWGVEIDWNTRYRSEKRNRQPLPTYPFERRKYWIEGNPFQIGARLMSGGGPRRKADISDWYYLPSWKRSHYIPPSARLNTGSTGCWLVLCEGDTLSHRLVEKLEGAKQTVVTVTPGNDFQKLNANRYTLNPGRKNDEKWDDLFKELTHAGLTPDKIVHLWGISGNERESSTTGAGQIDSSAIDETLDREYYSLLNIAAALGKNGIQKEIRIVAVTANMQEVTGNDLLYPGKATILGPLGVIPIEYGKIACSSIDITLPDENSPAETRLVDRILGEITAITPEPEVALRGEHRWLKVYEPLHLPLIPDQPSPLKHEGVYLITGGLGGIGLVLAEHLAKQVKARLIITGRTPLPPREQWKQLLAGNNKNDPAADRIRNLTRLEELGAEVHFFNADVTRQEDMKIVIETAVEKFGCIDGVIHAAGLPDGELIRRRTRESSERIFAAKIRGTLVLVNLMQNLEPDFILLCSSLNSVVHAMGQVAYCSANAFLDALALHHYHTNYIQAQKKTKITALSWDRWQGTGMSILGERMARQLTGQELTGGITHEEGVEIFNRALTDIHPHIIISNQDIDRVIEQARLMGTAGGQAQGSSQSEIISGETVNPENMRPRPDLSTPYIAPGNDLERKLAQVWQNFLGIREIGIRDDFLELGGDSLKAIALIARMEKAANVSVTLAGFFQWLTLEKLCTAIAQTGETTYSEIKPAERKEYYPLSSPQKRLYILQQLEQDNISYNETLFVLLEGTIDKSRFQKTVQSWIERHEALRTSIEIVQGEPVQRIHDIREMEVAIEHHTAESGTQEEAETIIRKWIRPFDLGKAPLSRFAFIKLKEDTHILVIDRHHIITDGTSTEIFVREFRQLLEGRKLAPLKLHYKDYSQWQQSPAMQEKLKTQEEFWLKEFAHEIPVLNLPLDFPRPPFQSFAGSVARFDLGNEDRQALIGMIQAEEVTLFMFFLMVYNAFLFKLSGQEDIIIGTPIVGRRHADLENIVGMFVNTLALRGYPAGYKTCREMLKEIKEKTLRVFENQEYQFEDLVEKLDLTREASRNPLFDVMFSLQNVLSAAPLPGKTEPGILEMKPYSIDTQTTKFDLTLTAADTGSQIQIDFEYCTKLFHKETILRYMDYFKKIILTIIREPDIKLADIDIISPEEKNRLLYDFNQTEASFPRDMRIHELFEQQAEQTPDSLALVGNLETTGEHEAKPLTRHHLTYRHIQAQTAQLASMLKEKGIGTDTIVSIILDRSIEMVLSILGILKAGGAYLPIEPGYPEERINYILMESGAEIVITTPGRVVPEKSLPYMSYLSYMPTNTVEIPSGSSSAAPAMPGSLAYIIYTSGSTGKPKGVLVNHESVINTLWALQNRYPLTAEDTYLLKTAVVFDVSVAELFGWFLGGGRLAILEKGAEKDPGKIIEALLRYRVTHINFVPSLFSIFLDLLSAPGAPKLRDLKYIFAAGEALMPGPVHKFRELPGETLLENLYGPTEGTVYTTYYSLSQWKGEGNIPIGKPLYNVEVYILDRYNLVQPIGIAGELTIAGTGLARGYLNQPELTAEKFISKFDRSYMSHLSHITYRTYSSKKLYKAGDPAARGAYKSNVFYRTGDLARWQPDGNIEFLGRMDTQLKIRGYRVEAGEIENRLMAYNDIKETVVVGRKNENSETVLCAYYTAETEITVTQLRGYLSTKLPDYMIPAYFIHLEQFPLTPTGKIDKKTLPPPGEIRPTLGTSYTPPGNELEMTVTEIWQEVLKIDKIGIHDNFFDLGGNSLSVVKVNNLIQSKLGKRIPAVKMFRYPTIESYAGHIKQEEANVIEDKEIAESVDMMEESMQLLLGDDDE